MAWWQRWFPAAGPGRVEAKRADPVGSAWAALLGGEPSKAGAAVSAQGALRVSVVLACCRVIAEGVAQLPFKLYRETAGGGREVASDHPVNRLIHRRPNAWMTAFEFREALTFHAVLTGSGFALKNRVGGQVRELVPVMPGAVTVRRAGDGSAEFALRDRDGREAVLPRSEILHLKGPTWDGLAGLDMVREAREAIGLAMATEETHARLHANGARPGGILSTEQPLTREQVAQVREAWMAAQAGVANAYKAAVLPYGFRFAATTMSGLDAQHLETRRFQIEDVCRFMRVFPQMVMQADKTATYASAEQFFLAHVIHSLGPWVERWEQVADRDLLTEAEVDDGLYAKFSLQGLLRGAAADRASFYSRGILDGWMTRNEARAFEELDPIEGLDEPLRPLNMGSGTEPPPPDPGDAPPADDKPPPRGQGADDGAD